MEKEANEITKTDNNAPEFDQNVEKKAKSEDNSDENNILHAEKHQIQQDNTHKIYGTIHQ